MTFVSDPGASGRGPGGEDLQIDDDGGAVDGPWLPCIAQEGIHSSSFRVSEACTWIESTSKTLCSIIQQGWNPDDVEESEGEEEVH